MKRIKKENLNIYIIVALIMILIFIMIYYYAVSRNSFSKYKQDKKEKIVYSIYNKDKINVPTINVKGKNIDKLNDKIIDKANKYISKNNRIIDYDYQINGKILSLAIQYVDSNEKGRSPKITYDVYNINLKTKKILNKKDILDIYEIKKSDVEEIVAAKFSEYYSDILKKGYMKEDICDYECFLYFRGIVFEQYLKEYYYYIKNGDLYVIRPFNLFSYYDEDKYFTSKHFFIQITK